MGKALDYSTLYFCGMVTAFSASVAMFYVWRAHRRDSAVRYWFFGFAAWAASMLLISFRGVLPPVFGAVIGNVFGVGCITLLYVGSARFLGKPPALRLLSAFYLPTFAVFVYWGAVEDSIIHRVLAYSVSVVVTLGLMVRDLWTSGTGPQRASYRFVATAFFAAIVVTLLRAWYLLQGAENSHGHVALPLTVWFVTINIVNLLGCMGFVLMVSQRLQEKNNWARIEELFHETLRLPAQQRVAHLRNVCDGDETLFAELESLVRAAETPDDELDGNIALGALSQAEPATALRAGTRLGELRVERLIGQGGMGEVYLAAHEAADTPVAIKLLRAEAREHVERFQAEQRIVGRLVHPGIARVLGGGVVDDGRPYMALEYVAGETITAYCHRWHLALKQRLGLFREVCEAVAYAHANLVVHRDLKPSNVLVTEDGRVKLLDFGVAKLLNPLSVGDATVTRMAPFTPEYAAPEQLEGRRITAATDVYALGMLLYELLTEELPWKLKTLPASVALHKVLHEPPPRVSEVAATKQGPPVLARLLRPGLDAIVGKCLRKNAKDRYTDVAALLADLTQHLEGATVTARGASRFPTLAHLLPTPRARLALAVTLALLLGFGAGAWIAAQRPQPVDTAAADEKATVRP